MTRVGRTLTLFLAAGIACATAQTDDVILKAMNDEMQRSKTLRLPGLDAPYYVEYLIEDADMVGISASLGALMSDVHSPLRIQEVKVRVGNYDFDNTDYVFSDAFRGARYDSTRLPIDSNYPALRNILWLATDRAFKTAEEGIARKKSALKNLSVPDALPDYTKTDPVRGLLPCPRTPINEALWRKRTIDLSAVFASYPDIQSSSVQLSSAQSTSYFVNSEGTEVREPDNESFVRIQAHGQAADGSPVRGVAIIESGDLKDMPTEAELRRATTQVAENVTALVHAPQGYPYDGPVLFEGRAAAQLFGQVLGDNLKLQRKPVGEPGRATPYRPGELETRVGSRVLPDWMDVVDDPTLTEFKGQRLLGHYVHDQEGVKPKPLTLIDKGVLKDFLRTRTPAVKGFEGSNGHARFPGSYGADAAGIGNLFVRASQTVPAGDMKKKFVEMCKQRNKPYCLIVRELDWPSSASFEELRREATGAAQSGGRLVSLPLLVYRVDTDGKEELVRGLRFRGLSTRSFKDVVAASDQPYVYNYLDSAAPLGVVLGGGFVANSTIIAPSVIIDDIEFEQILDDLPTLPIVPAPPLK